METVRDIAIIVLVIQALIIWLALLVCGILCTVFIIESTVTIRRLLRRASTQTRAVSYTHLTLPTNREV